jgi:hypothetical protein
MIFYPSFILAFTLILSSNMYQLSVLPSISDEDIFRAIKQAFVENNIDVLKDDDLMLFLRHLPNFVQPKEIFGVVYPESYYSVFLHLVLSNNGDQKYIEIKKTRGPDEYDQDNNLELFEKIITSIYRQNILVSLPPFLLSSFPSFPDTDTLQPLTFSFNFEMMRMKAMIAESFHHLRREQDISYWRAILLYALRKKGEMIPFDTVIQTIIENGGLEMSYQILKEKNTDKKMWNKLLVDGCRVMAVTLLSVLSKNIKNINIDTNIVKELMSTAVSEPFYSSFLEKACVSLVNE